VDRPEAGIQPKEDGEERKTKMKSERMIMGHWIDTFGRIGQLRA
jgi:hypothetical protein